MKVCFETFGCRLNRAEALQTEADYNANGWETTSSHRDADLIVVRCCSVTQRAQRECERLIAHLKQKYPAKHVISTGCTKDKTKGSAPILRIPGETNAVPTRTARAYLKVQDGCNCACTFCIVPTFRGKSVSLKASDVLTKAEQFIKNGYHEIVVTGCNLSQYLSDGMRLPELLDAIANIAPDECRIRLGSLEPSPVAEAVADVMSSHDNFCRYLHIPVQSGSDRILSAMRRPYTHRDVDALVCKATRLMPQLGLGCDIMTGFPDETDTDFLATKGLLARLPFTKAHVFPYSERPGTFAVALPNPVHPSVRSARAHEIAALADEARVKYINRFKGREVKMLIEHEDPIAGWTSEYVWCQIGDAKKELLPSYAKTNPLLKRKNIVSVRIIDAKGHVLFGDPV